jgi:hypothetical protein
MTTEAETKTIAIEDYTKLDERAKRFEGMVVELQKQLEPFKSLNLEELKAAKEERDILKRQSAGIDEEKFNQIIQEKEKEIRNMTQKEIDELKSKYDLTNKELKELKIVDKGIEKVGNLFKKDTHGIIKDFLRKSVSLNEDGDFVVLDDKGKARYSKENVNKYMTLEEYAKEIAAAYPSLSENQVSNGSKGGGERYSGSGGYTLADYNNPETRKNMSLEDRRKFATEKLKGVRF